MPVVKTVNRSMRDPELTHRFDQMMTVEHVMDGINWYQYFLFIIMVSIYACIVYMMCV